MIGSIIGLLFSSVFLHLAIKVNRGKEVSIKTTGGKILIAILFGLTVLCILSLFGYLP